MEIRSRNILGLPVFAVDHGEKLGQVKDYVFHPEKQALIALVIAGAKRFGEEKILPIANIKSFGQEAITLVNNSALEKKGDNQEIATYLKKMANIIGVNVITTNGGSLGKATDFFIDSTTGKVTCIALSGSVFDQFFKGKNYLSAEMIEVFGSDVILAKENAVATSVKPREAMLQPLTKEKQEIKEAHSGSLWNQGKEKIVAKTKEYTKKIPVSAVFTEVPREKENPSDDETTEVRAKGKIVYKEES